MPFKYAKKSTKTMKRVYKKRTPLRSSKKLIKTIQSVVNKNLEDKRAFKSSVDISYNSGINSQTDLVSLVPSINIGTGDASRVGAQITAKSLIISGHILSNLTSLSYSSCRIGCRLMVVSPKGYAGYEPAYNSATTWLAQLLRRGATTVGFTGTVTDFYSPINTDVITCHYDKKFFIKAPYMPAGVSGEQHVSSSTKFFKIKVPCKRKLLKYDAASNSGLTPIAFNPFIILGYCHLDNSTPDTLDTQLNMSFSSVLTYQDA